MYLNTQKHNVVKLQAIYCSSSEHVLSSLKPAVHFVEICCETLLPVSDPVRFLT